jgi:autotransporter-associated beta strand protein
MLSDGREMQMLTRGHYRFHAVVILLLITAAPAWGGPLYWDGTSTSGDADGGNGTWDNGATPNWMDAPTGGNNVVWDSTDANFGASAGSVNVDSASNVSANSLQFNVDGYTITGTGSLTLTGAGTIGVSGANAATLGTGSGTGTTTLAIGGTVGLTKTGTGVLVLDDANTYSGATTISSGTLSINADSRLGAVGGTVNFASGAALRLTGTGIIGTTTPRAFNLGSGTAIFDVTGTNEGTFAGSATTGTFSGSTGSVLQKVGTGAMWIRTTTGSASVGWDKTLINAGTLNVFSDANLGKIPAAAMQDNITLDGGALRFYSSGFSLNANRGIFVGPNGGWIQDDTSSGNPALGQRISGSGTLTLGRGNGCQNGNSSFYTGTSDFSGTLVVSSGRHNPNRNDQFTWGPNSTIVLASAGAGTFLGVTVGPSAGFTPTLPQNIILAPTTVNGQDGFSATTTGILTLTGKISGTGGFNVNGYAGVQTGTIVLNHTGSASDFTGPVTVIGGMLKESAADQIPDNVPVVTNGVSYNGTAGAGTFNLNGQTDLVGSLAGTGTVLVGAGSLGIGGDNTNQTFSGVITGAGNLYKSGTGIASFSNAGNTLSGIAGVSGGTLLLTSTGVLPATTFDVASGVFDVSQKASFAIANGKTIKGNGTVVGNLTIAGTISPGESAGVLHTGNQTWQNGGNYVWELSDASDTSNASAGSKFDQLRLDQNNGSLTVSASAGGFTLNVTANGLNNFNNQASYEWIIASTSGGISGFDPSAFTLNTSNFTNTVPLNGGFFSIRADSSNVYLDYVPEPTGVAMLLTSAALLLNRRRRTRRPAQA